ncbi:PilN domain-containing protein [Vibrio scophthalmi]|uniref:Putative fimbrial assembly protein PilN n=1 Tax=Vibrio scophthalmi LMG 19158 TaxID=870967 RepID=F9RRB9_9VIBR|nr:PilN domain-containing protein [Vibrio scophthalmi]EGU33468.1 putative fimbrial assembly protein PilN [Vibrio scophthalmi LMG 19158]
MLASINLLPWREQRRRDHAQRFLILLGLSVLVSGLIQYSLSWSLTEQQTEQQRRLDLLQRYSQQLDARLSQWQALEQRHEMILGRLSVIESLQVQRSKMTRLMNVLPPLIPEGVYADRVSISGQKVVMSGISETTSHLATMLNRLEQTIGLSEVEMHSIVHDKRRFGQKYQSFHVSFSFTPQLDTPSQRSSNMLNGGKYD